MKPNTQKKKTQKSSDVKNGKVKHTVKVYRLHHTYEEMLPANHCAVRMEDTTITTFEKAGAK